MSKYIDIGKQIEQKELELTELRLKKAEFEKLNEPIKLAEILHEKMCTHNHTDGCGWYYSNWENPQHERKEYLGKAKDILKCIPYRQAVRVIEIL